MNIIIIEDEQLTAEDLAATIIKVYPDARIIAMLRSVKEGQAFFAAASQDADLIFSDIQLGDGTAFELFADTAVQTPVIFCTAYDEYALDAFKSNGIDYILKPFTDNTIAAALSKYQSLKEGIMAAQPQSFGTAMKTLSSEKKESNGAILVYQKDMIVPVAMEDIAYFCFKNGAVQLAAFDQKTYPLNKSLDELEKTTGPSFFRMNRQYLVNRTAVGEVLATASRKLSVSLTVSPDAAVVVSREKAPQFLEWLRKET